MSELVCTTVNVFMDSLSLILAITQHLLIAITQMFILHIDLPHHDYTTSDNGVYIYVYVSCRSVALPVRGDVEDAVSTAQTKAKENIV
jgi:hypothetical protein